MTHLFIIPKMYIRKKTAVFLNNKKAGVILNNTPLEIRIKKPDHYLVNIKEGLTKNHYFYLNLGTDKILFLKKKFDFFGTKMVISQQKDFRTLINYSREKLSVKPIENKQSN